MRREEAFTGDIPAVWLSSGPVSIGRSSSTDRSRMRISAKKNMFAALRSVVLFKVGSDRRRRVVGNRYARTLAGTFKKRLRPKPAFSSNSRRVFAKFASNFSEIDARPPDRVQIRKAMVSRFLKPFL
ncbi:MAG: hypothetical protein HPM95_02190 [Alphaproteobacteria bacterium]|nr:hypothetical protein [Alphaproteobacteria bacterium]